MKFTLKRRGFDCNPSSRYFMILASNTRAHAQNVLKVNRTYVNNSFYLLEKTLYIN